MVLLDAVALPAWLWSRGGFRDAGYAGMVFVTAGLLLGPQVLGELDLDSSGGTVRTLAEATLALVLFCDASRIDLRELRVEANVPVRLLAVGLPLTIALGAVAAAGSSASSRSGRP